MKKVWKIISTALAILVIAGAALLVGVRLFGLTPYTILSGSMEPTYDVGSLIYVKRVSPLQVKVGDPITFVFNEDLDVATHRVTMIDSAKSHFYTKGDANDSPDAEPVHYNNLIGIPQFSIPYLGYAASFLASPAGRYAAIAAVSLLFIASFLPDILARRKKAKARKTLDTDQPAGSESRTLPG